MFAFIRRLAETLGFKTSRPARRRAQTVARRQNRNRARLSVEELEDRSVPSGTPSLPATGSWEIYSIQKTLPVLGQVGGILGAHNYVAIVDPNGNIVEEMHGVYTKDFTMFGPTPGNYLQVQNWQPNQYMSNQSITSAKIVYSGTQDQMQALYQTGYTAVKNALDNNHELYDGAELFGHADNSDSVWNTALSAMGAQDTSKFDGPLSTPGNSVDLRTEPTNNKWLNTPQDPWSPNPGTDTIFFDPSKSNRSEEHTSELQ